MRIDKKTGKIVQNDTHEVDIKIFFTPTNEDQEESNDYQGNLAAETMARRIATLLLSHFDGNPLNVADEHLSWVASKAIVAELKSDYRRTQQQLVRAKANKNQSATDVSNTVVYHPDDNEREPIVSRPLQRKPVPRAQRPGAAAPVQTIATDAQTTSPETTSPEAATSPPAALAATESTQQESQESPAGTVPVQTTQPAQAAQAIAAAPVAAPAGAVPTQAPNTGGPFAPFLPVLQRILGVDTEPIIYDNIILEITRQGDYRDIDRLQSGDKSKKDVEDDSANDAQRIYALMQHHENRSFPIIAKADLSSLQLLPQFLMHLDRVLAESHPRLHWRLSTLFPYVIRSAKYLAQLGFFVPALPVLTQIINPLISKMSRNKLSRLIPLESVAFLPAKTQQFINRHYFLYSSLYVGALYTGYISASVLVFCTKSWYGYRIVSREEGKICKHIANQVQLALMQTRGGAGHFGKGQNINKDDDDYDTAFDPASPAALARRQTSMFESAKTAASDDTVVIASITVVTPNQDYKCVLKRKHEQHTKPAATPDTTAEKMENERNQSNATATAENATYTPASVADVFSTASVVFGTFTQLSNDTLWLPREIMATTMAFLCKARVNVIEVPATVKYFNHGDGISFSTTSPLTPSPNMNPGLQRPTGMLHSTKRNLKRLLTINSALTFAFYAGVLSSLLSTFVAPRLLKLDVDRDFQCDDRRIKLKSIVDVTQRVLRNIDSFINYFYYSYHTLLGTVSCWMLLRASGKKLFSLLIFVAKFITSEGGSQRDPFQLLKIYCNKVPIYCQDDQSDRILISAPTEKTLIKFTSHIAQRIRKETRKDDNVFDHLNEPN